MTIMARIHKDPNQTIDKVRAADVKAYMDFALLSVRDDEETVMRRDGILYRWRSPWDGYAIGMWEEIPETESWWMWWGDDDGYFVHLAPNKVIPELLGVEKPIRIDCNEVMWALMEHRFNKLVTQTNNNPNEEK